jgi:hypothetical protein
MVSVDGMMAGGSGHLHKHYQIDLLLEKGEKSTVKSSQPGHEHAFEACMKYLCGTL